MDEGPGEVTRLLAQWSAGEQGVSERLAALVHEAYLRLVGQHEVEWHSRAHFLGIAASMMRRVLVDYARKHHAAKRGGGWQRQTLHEEMLVADHKLADVLALNEALDKLAVLDPQQSRLVELRFFAGLGVEEIAGLMNVSTPTVKREWRSAKAWLQRQMAAPDECRSLAAH